jgi:hypothetical protein
MSKTERPELTLTGVDGNAFAILGRAVRAAQAAGKSADWIAIYLEDAKSKDYHHLLATTLDYFNVS